MQAFVRITLLTTFAAAGVGVAIAIAARPPKAAPTSVPDRVLERDSAIAAGNAPAIAADPLIVLAAQQPAPPTPAQYRPSVTQNVEVTQRAAPAAPSESTAVADSLTRLNNFLDAQQLAAQNEARRPPTEEQFQPLEPPSLPTPVEPADAAPEPLRSKPAKISRADADEHLTINVQNSDIREVLELLSQQGGLNILASKNVTGTVTASLSGVDINEALAAILKSTGFIARREGNIMYVGSPADFLSMDQTADRLLTRVYRPNYIKAADLQALIVPLLTAQIGRATISTPAEVDIPADQTKTGGNNLADSDVVIVRDYEAIIAQVDQIFTEVDVKPRQVSIEAMILSVKLSDQYKMGVDFALLRNKANLRVLSGQPLNSLANLNIGEGGLNLAFLDDSAGVFINALETIGDTNVIASPRLTCLNKQRAEIQIGEELGYISTTVTETTAVQTVNFLDVGTLLRIRPFISNDGQIRLEIHPELSTGTVSEVGGQTLPNKTVTQVTTNVMCSDGNTVIIGGLIREDLQTDTQQLPFLGNLPYVGPVFRQKSEQVDRSEIIVLITPRIMCDADIGAESKQLGNEFTERQSVYFDKMSPIGKRNYGNHWLRKSRAAFAAGDYDTAMRQVNMAIHFDPVNRDAINLREEIVAAGGFENESIHQYLKQGLPPLKHSHRDYSKKGFPWKKAEGFGDVPPSLSDDPGTPGPVRTIEPDLQPLPARFPAPVPVESPEALAPIFTPPRSAQP